MNRDERKLGPTHGRVGLAADAGEGSFQDSHAGSERITLGADSGRKFGVSRLGESDRSVH
jgi:hypothetical protein